MAVGVCWDSVLWRPCFFGFELDIDADTPDGPACRFTPLRLRVLMSLRLRNSPEYEATGGRWGAFALVARKGRPVEASIAKDISIRQVVP